MKVIYKFILNFIIVSSIVYFTLPIVVWTLVFLFLFIFEYESTNMLKLLEGFIYVINPDTNIIARVLLIFGIGFGLTYSIMYKKLKHE